MAQSIEHLGPEEASVFWRVWDFGADDVDIESPKPIPQTTTDPQVLELRE